MGGEENISMKAIFNLSIAYNMLIFFEFDTKKNFLLFFTRYNKHFYMPQNTYKN
jgi:hypothetical protein